MGIFERKHTHREDAPHEEVKQRKADLILFGLGRFGTGIAEEVRRRQHRVMGIDFDPELVRRLEGQGYQSRYGDAEDPEFLLSLPLDGVDWVLSSVREKDINMALLHGLKHAGYKGRIAVTAHSAIEAEQLKAAGADRVLVPYSDAAAEAVDKIYGEDNREKLTKRIR